MILFWVVLVIFILFAVVILRGAPYVPTHKATIVRALSMLPLKPGATVVDLGSGDGAFIKAAALRGYKAIGYELNPILCLVAWLRCIGQRGRVTIKLRDFWLTNLPLQTDAVFVFLVGPHMKHLGKYLKKQMVQRRKPLLVISHGFAIPGLVHEKRQRGLYLYKLQP